MKKFFIILTSLLSTSSFSMKRMDTAYMYDGVSLVKTLFSEHGHDIGKKMQDLKPEKVGPLLEAVVKGDHGLALGELIRKNHFTYRISITTGFETLALDDGDDLKEKKTAELDGKVKRLESIKKKSNSVYASGKGYRPDGTEIDTKKPLSKGTPIDERTLVARSIMSTSAPVWLSNTLFPSPIHSSASAPLVYESLTDKERIPLINLSLKKTPSDEVAKCIGKFSPCQARIKWDHSEASAFAVMAERAYYGFYQSASQKILTSKPCTKPTIILECATTRPMCKMCGTVLEKLVSDYKTFLDHRSIVGLEECINLNPFYDIGLGVQKCFGTYPEVKVVVYSAINPSKPTNWKEPIQLGCRHSPAPTTPSIGEINDSNVPPLEIMQFNIDEEDLLDIVGSNTTNPEILAAVEKRLLHIHSGGPRNLYFGK